MTAEEQPARGPGGWDEVLETEAYHVAPGAEWRSELYRVALEQFERAADVLDLEPDLRQRLTEPRRSLTVNFPVHRDSGEMHEALTRVVAASEDYGTDWRTAALAVGLDRVAEASRLRAVYP